MHNVVHLSLGSNLGDRLQHLRRSLEWLKPIGPIRSVSSLYETAPLHMATAPRFYNAVLSQECQLEPVELLKRIKGYEADCGRDPDSHNLPRVIDIDILFVGNRVIHTPELQVPHPRLAERAFILVPLAEIAPAWVHPVFEKSVIELLRVMPAGQEMRRILREWEQRSTGE